jgi:hypothetical protein
VTLSLRHASCLAEPSGSSGAIRFDVVFLAFALGSGSFSFVKLLFLYTLELELNHVPN